MDYKNLPTEYLHLLPSESAHISYGFVVRGASICPNCIDNFRPSFIENPRRFEKYRSQRPHDIGMLSLSIYVSIDSFEREIRKLPSLSSKLTFVAVGQTSLDYGVSVQADVVGHIDYFLFDWIGNNPWNTFNIMNRGETL